MCLFSQNCIILRHILAKHCKKCPFMKIPYASLNFQMIPRYFLFLKSSFNKSFCFCCMLGVHACLRALRVYVLACSRARRVCVFACWRAWRVCVLTCWRVQRACMLTCWHTCVLACLACLRAGVLAFLRAWRVCVLAYFYGSALLTCFL